MKSLLLASFSLPLVACYAGERAATGECPAGETCSDATPRGLSFVGNHLINDLLLSGPRASCMRALQPESPLDDPELEVVRHALFTVDGAAKHLSGIPAGDPLVFYAEAFQSIQFRTRSLW